MLTPEEKMVFIDQQARLTGLSREEILAFLKRVEDAERRGEDTWGKERWTTPCGTR